MGDLEDKVAIVTGGGSGIGADAVRLLSERGAKVLAADVNEVGLAGVAAATGCATRVVDVTDEHACRAMAQAAVTELGGLDIALLNAGILGRPVLEQGDPYELSDLDTDLYRLVRAVNLDGVVYGTIACGAAMARTGGGTIVATASVAGLMPWGPDPFYTATKHGVVGWVRAVAPVLHEQGVCVNAICPGGVATPLVGARDDAQRADFMLAPAQVAAEIVATALDGGTGRAMTVVAGHDPLRQEFAFPTIAGFD